MTRILNSISESYQMFRSIAALFLVCGSIVSAQETGDFITVIAVPQAELRIDGEVVTTVERGVQLQVLDVGEGAFLVRWEGTRGWIGHADIIPIEDSVEYFTLAIQAEPTADDHHARGLAWSHQGELERSLEDFDEAIRLDATQARFWGNRGVSHHRLGDLKRALDDYNEAIRLDPDESHFWFSRGLVRANRREYNQAIDDYNEAIRRNPGKSFYFHSRGASLSSRGDYEQAIADYDRALKINPDYPPTHYNRAYAAEKQGDYQQAIDDYMEALRLAPLYADALNNLAWLLATCPDETLRDGKRAVEFAQGAGKLAAWKESYYYGTLAAAYAETGEFDKAVESQRKAIELADDSDKADLRERLALYEAGMPYYRDLPE